MAKRTKGDQTRHDQAVKRSAQAHRRMGHKVWADVPGFQQPDKRNG